MPEKLRIYSGTAYFTSAEKVWVVASSQTAAEEKIERGQSVLLNTKTVPTLDDIMVHEEVQTITIRQGDGPDRDPNLPLQLRPILIELPVWPDEKCNSCYGYSIVKETAKITPEAYAFPKTAWKLIPPKKEKTDAC